MLQVSPQPNALAAGRPSGMSWRFWLMVLGTGVGAGLGGGLLMKLLRATQHFAWSYDAGEFVDAVARAGPSQRIAVLLGAGLLAGGVGWLMQQQPGGHGGELAEKIWFHSGRLPFFRTLARAVLSIVIVGMGASLGREAAPKQTGAAVASLLAQWARLTAAEQRLLVACGAGAGVAAVYNVPFGGALFALEVLLGSLALPLVAPALAASLIATATSWLLLPDQPTYHMPSYPLSTGLVLFAAIAGPVAGLAGILYVRLIAWADSRKPEGWARVVAPFAVFLVLAILALFLPDLLGNGKDAVQETFLGEMGVPLLAVLLILKPLATAGCLGSGAPGGLFTPTMTAGAMLGGLLGKGWALLWPGVPAGACALIGAAALLAVAMQGPISAIVLMTELVHRIDPLMVPMLLAVAAAAGIARRLEPRSIYSARVHAGKAAAPEDGDTVSAAAGHGEVLQKLLQRRRSIRVVDERGAVIGEISPEMIAGEGPPPIFSLETASDLAKRKRHLARLEASPDPRSSFPHR